MDRGPDIDANRVHIERLSPKKKWSEVYDHRVSEIREEQAANRVPEERRNLAQAIAMGSIIAKRLGKKVRNRLQTKKFSCRRTIDNLHEPGPPAQWPAILGTQVICDICGLIALNDCVACGTCNAVAHRLCVGFVTRNVHCDVEASARNDGGHSFATNNKSNSEEQSSSDSDDEEDTDNEDVGEDRASSGHKRNLDKDDQSNAGSEMTVSILSDVGGDDYQCVNCRRDMEEDNEFYDKLHYKLAIERRFILAVRVVARKILAFVERSRFKKLRKGLVLIQSCIRRRKAKKWLYYLRRNQIRVVILYFTNLPLGLLKTDIVCVTCIDTMKHGQQLFRFDKTVAAIEANHEAIFVPGMNAMMTIIVSILRLDEHSAGTIYNILAQSQLSVRDGDYTERRTYNLSLTKNIVWCPYDTRGDYHYHIEKLRNNVAPKKGAKGSVANTVEDKKTVGILASDGTRTTTAESKQDGKSVTPSHKEDASDAKAHSKRSSSTGYQQSGGPSTVAEAKANSIDLNEQAAALSQQKIRLMYQPLNPISSICLLASGPPLEDLRKPAETDLRLLAMKKDSDTGKMKSMVEGRTTLWWLVLCRLKLYFFQYHGDPKPRLIADITQATCEVDPMYLHRTVVSIKHADKRVWLIEFEDFKKALKFEFAVLESQEAAKRDGGSMFMKSADLKQKFDFGHASHVY